MTTFEFHDSVLAGATLRDGVLELSFDILQTAAGDVYRSVSATIVVEGVTEADSAPLLAWSLPTWLRGEGVHGRDGSEIAPSAEGLSDVSRVELARSDDARVVVIAARTIRVTNVGPKRPVRVHR